MQRIVLFSLVGLVLGGCAAQQQDAGEEPMVRIKPSRSYEECVQTLPGQAIEYSFQASKPVDFNIHYHRGETIIFPVSEKETMASQGALDCHQAMEEPSEKSEYFCLMWENPHDVSVGLDFEYTVTGPPDTE
jgi:hypothetical protein